MSMPNACASNLGIKLNITGVNSTVCSACAAGTVAVGHGFRAISTGQLDMAFVGGAENMNDDFGAIFRGFDSIGALARNYDNPQVANRPFDTLRSGFLFSQGGAAILVLEELDRARQRGAPVLAEIIGFFETCDAHNIMVLDQSGLQIERMLRMLLQEAGLEPGEVDYINAHGTGTQVNDETESLVIERIFGRKPLVNSTKSLIGHTIGASGAIEALVAACSIYHQTTHACKNLHQPLRDLNFVKEVKKYPIRTALSQSFAFGGQNAGIALREYR
jgi:3-oxoacyl-[acyl-carrier-protein] synthase II